jgi:hypothetical protein
VLNRGYGDVDFREGRLEEVQLSNILRYQDRRSPASFGVLSWMSDARPSATGVLDGQVRSYPLLCLDHNLLRVSGNCQAGAASV